jgi:hypothetical protein
MEPAATTPAPPPRRLAPRPSRRFTGPGGSRGPAAALPAPTPGASAPPRAPRPSGSIDSSASPSSAPSAPSAEPSTSRPSIANRAPPGRTYLAPSGTQRAGSPRARDTTASQRGSPSRSGAPPARAATARTRRSSSAATAFTNATFFATASQQVTSRSGRAHASTAPGIPAPLPRSSTVRAGPSVRRSARPSTRCFSATSAGAVTAVRFTLRFHARSRAAKARSRSTAASSSAISSAAAPARSASSNSGPRRSTWNPPRRRARA